jgi:nucleoside-diphosphate-sugar epimerase
MGCDIFGLGGRMKVLIAGATGAIGIPMVTRLMAAGDQVAGIVRSAAGADALGRLGAQAVGADVLDGDALLRAVEGRRYDAVIHELTALKKPPARYRDMSATNTLRTTGTANLLQVARAVGATRFVTQSIVFGYGYRDHGDSVLTEDDPFGEPAGGPVDPSLAAMKSAEEQVFADPDVEGVALRYGLFYGGDIAATTRMLRRRMLPVTSSVGNLALIHHDDAADATVAALHRGGADTAYNIVDDTPVTWRRYVEAIASMVHAPRPLVLPGWLLRAVAPYAGLFMTGLNMRVSNARARHELGWAPAHPSYLEGITDSAQRAGLAIGGPDR